MILLSRNRDQDERVVVICAINKGRKTEENSYTFKGGKIR